MKVLNIRLNWRGAVSVPLLPHTGHCASGWPGVPLIAVVGRKRFLHVLQSTSGSVKPATWPEASQTLGCIRIAASRPSMSSRSCTIDRHQRSLRFFLSSTPRGP